MLSESSSWSSGMKDRLYDLRFEVREAAVPLFDKLYHKIIYVWVVVIPVGIIGPLLSFAAFNGVQAVRNVPLVAWIVEHLVLSSALAGGVFVILLVLTLLGWRAHNSPLAYLAHASTDLIDADVRAVRVQTLQLRDFDLGPHPHAAYFERPPFELACKVLQRASRSGDEDATGIALFGLPMIGKTRLAFEAIHRVLPRWRLITWQHTYVDLPLDTFERFSGMRIALFLDNAHEYARQGEGQGEASRVIQAINRLDSACRSGGGQLVTIIASRQDSDTKSEFQPIFSKLILLTLEPIEGEEKHRFFSAMQAANLDVREDDTRYDGTPGSILLDLDRRTAILLSGNFLPDALAALKAMALLRAAYVDEFTEDRVRRVTQSVFGYCRTDQEWAAALGRLLKENWVRRGRSNAMGNGELSVPTDAYLDECVAEVYLNPGRPIEHDFPRLLVALDQTPEYPADPQALFALSAAYRLSPVLREYPLGSLAEQAQTAVDCVNRGLAALDPSTKPHEKPVWAIGQSALGLAYYDLARRDRTDSERSEHLEAAFDAFTLALSVHTREQSPVRWGEAMYNRAGVREELAQLSTHVDPRQCREQVAAALGELRTVLQVFTANEYPDKYERVTDRIVEVKSIPCR